MAHAELCPICKGSGYLTTDYTPTTAGMTTAKPCHGCNGKGWIEVQDSQTVYPYWVYYPIYIEPYPSQPYYLPCRVTWSNVGTETIVK